MVADRAITEYAVFGHHFVTTMTRNMALHGITPPAVGVEPLRLGSSVARPLPRRSSGI